jgi:hypothetical protein
VFYLLKGNKMTENEKARLDALLNPNFGLNTDKPDIKGFLAWLYDPEVTEAFEQFIKESEQE